MAESPGTGARRPSHELRDVKVRWIVATALAGALFVALSAASLYGLQRLYAALDVVEVEQPPALEREHPVPPPPRLQTEPAQDLATYLARENAALESYGWVDQHAGIARIPIDQAMRLVAERGWPQPATGPRPPPDAAQGLEPWPDWNKARPSSRRSNGNRAPERDQDGQ